MANPFIKNLICNFIRRQSITTLHHVTTTHKYCHNHAVTTTHHFGCTRKRRNNSIDFRYRPRNRMMKLNLIFELSVSFLFPRLLTYDGSRVQRRTLVSDYHKNSFTYCRLRCVTMTVNEKWRTYVIKFKKYWYRVFCIALIVIRIFQTTLVTSAMYSPRRTDVFPVTCPHATLNRQLSNFVK